MNDLEERYVALHTQLHTLAKQAAETKRALIAFYLAAYYSGVPYTLTIVDENILAVDLVFPGMDEARSQRIVDEVTGYLNDLLGVYGMKEGE